MWPRGMTKAIGMDEDKFTQALVKVFQNEAVQATLRETICSEMRAELKCMKDLITEQNNKIRKLESKIVELEQKTDEMEQYSRRNSLRVFGMAEKEHENPLDVTLKMINSDLGVEMDESSIDRVHRVGKRKDDSRKRPMLIKFATYRDRAKVFRAKTALKGHAKDVFINEDLTTLRSRLFYKARQLKKRKIIQDCWTYDGQLLIKNTHGRIASIRSEKELDDLEVP